MRNCGRSIAAMAKRRKHIPQSSRKARPRRSGTPYEDAVCELFREFFPGADIEAGVWVTGPDGRRELDVKIEQQIAGKTLRGVVECKDFNPQTTGPVGIAYLDALDSKRRDLGLDLVFLCCNAGFTADAIRKAQRVGIGLLGAVKKGDHRIRFSVVHEIYVRHIAFTDFPRIRCTSPTLLPEAIMSGGAVPTFEGGSIEVWAYQRFATLLSANPIVNGHVGDVVRFVEPIQLDWPTGSALVSKIELEFNFEGAWFAQTVTLDATVGLYDWLRRRIRMPVGPEPRQIHLAGINCFGGKWIARPPTMDWLALSQFEFDMGFVVLKNQIPIGNPANLSPHAVPEDLNLVIDGLGETNIRSTPGISPDRVPDAEVGQVMRPKILPTTT